MSNYPSDVMVTETPDSITFFDTNWLNHQVRRSHPRFDDIVVALKRSDIAAAIDLAKPIIAINEALSAPEGESTDELRYRRDANTDIVLTEWGLTIGGVNVKGYAVEKLLEFKRLGLDVTPLLNFIAKLNRNPSAVARAEMYLWLEQANMPITPDGDFIAFKRVRPNYRDIHSGQFDNSIGRTVSMSRFDVDDDRRRTCSVGLHFCSKDYLPHFSSSGCFDHIMLVKINPADVVSIPEDYDNAKGRTWRYVVVGEISLDDAGLLYGGNIYEADPDYDNWSDDADYDWSDDGSTQDAADSDVFASALSNYHVDAAWEFPAKLEVGAIIRHVNWDVTDDDDDPQMCYVASLDDDGTWTTIHGPTRYWDGDVIADDEWYGPDSWESYKPNFGTAIYATDADVDFEAAEQDVQASDSTGVAFHQTDEWVAQVGEIDAASVADVDLPSTLAQRDAIRNAYAVWFRGDTNALVSVRVRAELQLAGLLLPLQTIEHGLVSLTARQADHIIAAWTAK